MNRPNTEEVRERAPANTANVDAREERARRRVMIVLCLGALMTYIDAAIVNVALPAISADLRFSRISLVWVVNAYFLSFGGFLLLGGRLGDLFGQRRLFMLGISLFTLASLSCGLAISQGMLIGARAAQGLGGAVVSAVALSMMLRLFADPSQRTKALSVFGFVTISGGGIALLLGGTLTSLLSWRWIFLINVPIGAAVYLLSLLWLQKDEDRATTTRLDIAGALTVTVSLVIALYAVVSRNEPTQTLEQTLVLAFAAAAALVAFLVIESRSSAPLVPLAFFRLRSLVSGNVVGMLVAASLYSWYFICTLYLQLVLGYSPLQVGLAFLPSNQITAAFTIGLSSRLVIRFGMKPPLVTGLLLAAVGFVLFSLAPIGGSFAVNVLPGTLMVGIGIGMASTPLLLATMSDVAPCESGLASGVVSTASMMAGTLGLAALVSVADSRTKELMASGANMSVALNQGYHVAFFSGALLAVAAASIGAAFLCVGRYESVGDSERRGSVAAANVSDE